MAAEFAASAAANAVGNLATEYASPYVRYFFRYGKIVEEFKNQRKQLELRRDRVQNDIDKAKRQTEVIEKDVQEWLNEAEKELKDAQSLEAEIERKQCFNWCPSWGWRYCLSKQVAKKMPYITKLLESSNFQRVGYRAPLQGIEFFPSKDFKPFESSNLAFNGIMRALNTNGVNMIGLHGMPGVGKTTLAKEIGRHAKEQRLFDYVVIVTMSQTPNINRIQNKIAGILGLNFEESFEEGKAEELWRRLREVKKILIIIDDVWDEFELQTIGIPFDSEDEGCKILLTTRRQLVCLRMNCQETFQLSILSKNEAWALFKDTAGLNDLSSTLNDVAKDVASECKGLPLAIVSIGKALKGKDLNSWIAANQRLKDSRHSDNGNVCEGLYNCLKLSYDYLKEDNIRSCFLLCSLFPEDSNIGLEWLIMFGIGYGLFFDVYFMDVFRVEIRDALRTLQDSGLLLETDDSDDSDDDEDEIYVRIHDVVRDFAHWTTLREKNTFMVKAGLTKWPISESFGCYTSISFWKSEINNFPDKLEFPKLKILAFEGNGSMIVPSAFIEGMKALQILYLKNVSFSLKAFEIVRYIRTLCFEDCELEDFSLLRNLENLEILALLKTNIYELPKELVVLGGLKSLHFSYSRSQEINFPPNLLSRLTSLQELHVISRNNINLLELNSLSDLTALSLRVSTNQCFPENFVFPAKLKSYMIAVKVHVGKVKGLKFRTLKIKNFLSSLSAFKELFCNVEKLALEKVAMEHKNIVPSIVQGGLNELTSLELGLCNDLECLMDTTRKNGPTTVFSSLEKLVMRKMSCLEELCHGPAPTMFLQKLKDVTIVDCEQLKVVFQMDEILEKKEMVKLQEYQVAPLSNLTYLKLDTLPELKWIWKESSHYFNPQSLKVVKIFGCHRLKYLFSPSLTQSLVLLEQLEIRRCYGLEYVFKNPLAQGLPHLKSLAITDDPQLKHVFNVAKEKNAVDHAIALPCLQYLDLENLIDLSCFCSENYPIVSPSLEELFILDCPQLEIFNIQQEVDKQVRLKELHLCKAGSACYTTSWEKVFQIQVGYLQSRKEHIIHQLQSPIQIASLRKLSVSDFNRLKYLFSVMVARNLPQLISLSIENCEELEEIIEMEQTSIESSSSQGHLQPVSFPSLEVIWIEGCSNLKSLFPISTSCSLSKLKDIRIHGASKLEQVFGHQGELNVEVGEKGIEFPELERLNLLELPSLKSFAPTGYHFRFSSLKAFLVIKCHKLTTSFSVDSKYPAHAIREELQQAQNNTMEDFNIMEEKVDNQSTYNDIIWHRPNVEDQIPLYVNVGETRIMLRDEVKK